jgi:hypothetical protein
MSTTIEQPTLESGDRLSREEFHRRYCELPDLRAELVQGVVYVSSPTRYRSHDVPHQTVQLWLGTFALRDPRLHRTLNATVLLDADTEVQPDAARSVSRHRPVERGYARTTTSRARRSSSS